MNRINDGGPAFPVDEVRLSDGTGISAGHDGMSLRDHFAGQSLAGMLANAPYLMAIRDEAKHRGENAEDYIARTAYELADAMIKAREAQP